MKILLALFLLFPTLSFTLDKNEVLKNLIVTPTNIFRHLKRVAPQLEKVLQQVWTYKIVYGIKTKFFYIDLT